MEKNIDVTQIEQFIYAVDDEVLQEVIKDLSQEEKEVIYFMRFCKKIFDKETLYKKAQNIVGEMIYETLINE